MKVIVTEAAEIVREDLLDNLFTKAGYNAYQSLRKEIADAIRSLSYLPARYPQE